MEKLTDVNKKTIQSLMTNNLGIKPKENVLVLADDGTDMLVRDEVVSAARAVGAFVTLAMIKMPDLPNTPPPKPIQKALEGTDVFICLTTLEYNHAEAVKVNVLNNGMRLISMSGVTRDVLSSPCMEEVDWEELAQLALKVRKTFAQGDMVEITSDNGTHFTFSLKGKDGGGCYTGIARDIGTFAPCPGGDVSAGAVHGSANGIIVFDYFQMIGKLKTPIRLTVEKSWIVKVEGGEEAEQFKKIISSDPNGNYLAEALGLGLNPKSVLRGLPDLLNEKTMRGVLHVGIGDASDYCLPIRCRFHLDGAIIKPTLKLDGKVLMDKGQLQF
jgi:leucyl aminopeptidase (aminopeptidase T)